MHSELRESTYTSISGKIVTFFTTATLSNIHAKGTLISMNLGLDTIRTIKSQVRTCLAQFGPQLGSCKYWNIKHFARLEQLLRRCYNFLKFIDGTSEFLLQITDASEASVLVVAS